MIAQSFFDWGQQNFDIEIVNNIEKTYKRSLHISFWLGNQIFLDWIDLGPKYLP